MFQSVRKKSQTENINEISYGQMNRSLAMMTESTFKRNSDMTLTISNNQQMPCFKLFQKPEEKMIEEKPFFQQK